MSKITLTDLVNLQNETTAVNAINANNATIETAFDNTLSRDGTTPNQMAATLDMNSNPIINLPLPTSNYEPLRVIDAATLAAGGTITVQSLPTGGTIGQALAKNSSTNYDVSWQTLTGTSASYVAPYTGGVSRTVDSKLSDLVSVLDFGVSNVGADCTVTLQAAITASSVIIPPGTYTLTGDITVPANRTIWVQAGATITNTGGRFTSYLPNSGNVTWIIDGTMNFVATATATGLTGWSSNAGVETRGLIEFGGGTTIQPASHFRLTGNGKILADYVWVGVPSAYYDINYQLNRKGICLVNCNNAIVEGIEISNVHGECVYWQGPNGSTNIKFLNNYVHDVAFNGLNFNIFGTGHGFEIAGNYIQNSWQAIEASSGNIRNNYALSNTTGFLTGGGGGGGPFRVCDNTFHSSVDGISISFSPATYEDVVITGNQINNPGANGIVIGNISSFILSNNIIYTWATGSAGYGIRINASASDGYVDSNLLRAAGGFSLGNVSNASGSTTLGTNPVF